MKTIVVFATLLLGAIPAAAQTMPTAQPRTVQQVMQGIGGDWQSMETAKNHVVVGLGELQSLASELENKNRALTAELAETKKKLDASATEVTDLKKKLDVSTAEVADLKKKLATSVPSHK